MNKITDNIYLIKQPFGLIIVHAFLVLFSLSFFLAPVVYLDRFEENKALFLLISYALLFLLVGGKLYKIRHALLKSLESLSGVSYSAEIDQNGITLISKSKKIFYPWDEVDEIGRESTDDETSHDIIIVTNDSRIIQVADDSARSRFKILREWIRPERAGEKITSHADTEGMGPEADDTEPENSTA